MNIGEFAIMSGIFFGGMLYVIRYRKPLGQCNNRATRIFEFLEENKNKLNEIEVKLSGIQSSIDYVKLELSEIKSQIYRKKKC